MTNVYLEDQKSISKNLQKKIKSEYYYISKWCEELIEKGLLYRNYFVLGVMHLKVGEYPAALDCLQESMRRNQSFKLSKIYYYATLIAPRLSRFILLKKGESLR